MIPGQPRPNKRPRLSAELPLTDHLEKAVLTNDLAEVKRLWPMIHPLDHGRVFYWALRCIASEVIDFMMRQPDFNVHSRNDWGDVCYDMALNSCFPKIATAIWKLGGRPSPQPRDWYTAIVMGDLEKVKSIIDTEGTWVNSLWKSTKSYLDGPVHWAAQAGQLEVLILLIKRGIGGRLDAPGDNGLTPISRAAERGHRSIVKWIIHHNQGKIGRMGWLPGASPGVFYHITDHACRRALLQCDDCDLLGTGGFCKVDNNVDLNFKGWDIGDAACSLIATAILSQELKVASVINLSNNPRIGDRGLCHFKKALERRGKEKKGRGFTGTLVFSHLPPEWIRVLSDASKKIVGQPIEIRCPTPSLYTITLWYLVDHVSGVHPDHQQANIKLLQQRVPQEVYLAWSNIYHKT